MAHDRDAGQSVRVQRWGCDASDRLFYIHGLQSHGGWLFETGAELASRGVCVEVLDRPGSGLPRVPLPSSSGDLLNLYQRWLTETEVAGRRTVVGQSMGASVLAALVAERRVPEDFTIVLCAPALGQQRGRHTAAELDHFRGLSGPELMPVTLRDEDYPSLPEYLRWMANDAGMLRAITADFRRIMVELEDRILAAGSHPWQDRSVFVAVPAQDRIVNPFVAAQFLEALAPSAERTILATSDHYIEFSSARGAYWDWLARICTKGRP